MSTRVLLTEDDPRIRSAMRLVLEEDGYDVLEAASAERATETLSTQSADLLLLDVMLPGMPAPTTTSPSRSRRGSCWLASRSRSDDRHRRPARTHRVR